MERELLPSYQLGYDTPENLHFALDSHLPAEASHHEKIVVIDDDIAYIGGIDLTTNRFDDSEHAPDNSARTTPSGEQYKPFHDMQAQVKGRAANEVGKHFRERFFRATKKDPITPETIHNHQSSYSSSTRDNILEDAVVHLVRTRASYKEMNAVTETIHFYKKAIADAKKLIYIENQYLSSYAITESLETILEKKTGPEIIIIMPRELSGWLEESTIGIRQKDNINRLQKADKHDRLRVLTPYTIKNNKKSDIKVHAKFITIDDTILHIGSANLSNRSMGLDTEYGITLSVDSQTTQKKKHQTRNFIRQHRTRLLAEHTGYSTEKIEDNDRLCMMIDQHLESIDSKVSGKTIHGLNKFNSQLSEFEKSLIAGISIADPEEPLTPELLENKIKKGDFFSIKKDEEKYYTDTSLKKTILKLFLSLVTLVTLTLLWRYSPLKEYLSVEQINAYYEAINNSYLASIILFLLFIVAVQIMIPLNFLIFVTGLLIGSWQGFLISLTAGLVSSYIAYQTGRKFFDKIIEPISNEKILSLRKRMKTYNIFMLIGIRLVPVAPFHIVNLIAGSVNIDKKLFFLSTFIGLLPGVIVITFLSESFKSLLQQFSWHYFFIVSGIFILLGTGAVYLKRVFKKR